MASLDQTQRPARITRLLRRRELFNDVTAALIDYLLLRYRPRASLIIPWERRVTYGLDSDEGKALLATPNSIAVLWLLVHRREILGRRDPRVTMFDPGMSRRMMTQMHSDHVV